MKAGEIREKLVDWTKAHSGLEQRAYLGMSRIAECPLALFDEMANGRGFSLEMHLKCYAGYLWERDVKARLEALGLYAPGSERELTAAWDSRFRGTRTAR